MVKKTFFYFLFLPSFFYADIIKLQEWEIAYAQVKKGHAELVKIDKPLITFFGGAQVAEQDPYYKMAYDLSRRLAQKGFAIMTGGGSGIMKAGNCGAASVKDQGITSVAVEVHLEGASNNCSEIKIKNDEFFSRKFLLIKYASAFVIFPGGVGTMDELFDILVQMDTNKLSQLPIYIVGTSYWKEVKNWLTVTAKKAGYITQKTIDFVIFTDDLDQIENALLANTKKVLPPVQ